VAKRKKKAETPPEPALCFCGEPVWPDDEFCLLHKGINHAVSFVEDKMEGGDLWQGLLGQLGVLGLQAAGPSVQRMARNVAAGAERYAAAENGGFPPSGAPRNAPPPRRGLSIDRAFEILGLNKDKATEKDIKRVQAALAKIYHPDVAGAAVAEEQQVRVNAAAETCKAYIKQRDGHGAPKGA